MTDFIELIDDGDFYTNPFPPDGSVVEVRLCDGTIRRAWFSWFSRGLMEADDFDFLPVLQNDEPDIEANSIAAEVVAWRPLH